jgi:hypothetical protein
VASLGVELGISASHSVSSARACTPGGLQLFVAELEERVARTVEEARGWEGILDFAGDVDPERFVIEEFFVLGLRGGEHEVEESCEGFDVLDAVDETIEVAVCGDWKFIVVVGGVLAGCGVSNGC